MGPAPGRPSLSELTGRARLAAAAALLEAGDWMAAADAAAAAPERDPYDEAALRVLLRAHVMGGRAAGALSAARQRPRADAPTSWAPTPRPRRPRCTPRSCGAS